MYRIALSVLCMLCAFLFSYNAYQEAKAGHKGGASLMGFLGVVAVACIFLMIFVPV